MIRRLRVILPPAWVLVAFLLFYLLASIPDLLVLLQQGRAFRRDSVAMIFLMSVSSIAYGAYRVLAFHPFYRSDYRRWLETTPWTWKKPLPTGPIHLVWEDAFVLLAVGVPIWAQGSVNVVAMLALLLGAYLACLSVSFWSTGVWPFAYLVLFGLGLAIRFSFWPEACVVIVLGLYLVALVGLRLSLKRFPWDLAWLDEYTDARRNRETAFTRRRLGWPHDQLGPKFPDDRQLRRRDAVLGSLLAGWTLYAFGSILESVPNAQQGVYLTAFMYIFTPLLIYRIGSYVTGYSPPVSFLGRFTTFRWIVPGYDKVFLAPVAAGLVAVVSVPWLLSMGLPRGVVAPGALTLALLALSLPGPRLRSWRLTGHHRITPAFTKAGNQYVQVP